MLFKVPIGNRVLMRWNHALWLILLVLSVSLQASGQVANWRYDQALIGQGHYWLLFSGSPGACELGTLGPEYGWPCDRGVFFQSVWQFAAVVVRDVCIGFMRRPRAALAESRCGDLCGFIGVLHGLFRVWRNARSTRLSGQWLCAAGAAGCQIAVGIYERGFTWLGGAHFWPGDYGCASLRRHRRTVCGAVAFFAGFI